MGTKVRSVLAECAGIVLDVIAREGASVAEGQDLLLFESMKMEIPVEAPCAGKVVRVCVTKGQVFQENDVLMELEV